jgi:hypothetical protein
MGPPDWDNVATWGYGNDLGHWYEWEPVQGQFQSVYIQHQTTLAGTYELQTVIWGYPDGQGPTQNEPFWLASLPPSQQVQEYINALQWLEATLPKGTKVNLIAEPTHTNMSTVVQALGGTGATGEDGFIQAVKLARQYMPVYSATHLPIEISQLDINGLDEQMQLTVLQRVFIALWQSPYVFRIGYWASDPDSQTSYDGNNRDTLWRGDGSHKPALDWLIGYIPTSNPPNATREQDQ